MAMKNNPGNLLGELIPFMIGTIIAVAAFAMMMSLKGLYFSLRSIVRMFRVESEEEMKAFTAPESQIFQAASVPVVLPRTDLAVVQSSVKSNEPAIAPQFEIASRNSSIELVPKKDIYLHLRYYLKSRTMRRHIVVRDKTLIKKLKLGESKSRREISLSDFQLPVGMFFEEASAICVREALSVLEEMKGPKKTRKTTAKEAKVEYLPAPKPVGEAPKSAPPAEEPKRESKAQGEKAIPGKVVRGVLRYSGMMDGMNHNTKETYQTYGIQLESEGEDDGAITYMGVDLERAIEVSQASIGDLVELRFEGFVEVASGKSGRFNRKKKWSINIISPAKSEN